MSEHLWQRIQWLTLAGLIPFTTLSLAALFSNSIDVQTIAVEWVCLYTLSIVSFVGAISLGLVLGHVDLRDDQALRLVTVSILPSLIGCAAFLLPGFGRPLLLCLTVMLCFAIEKIYWPDVPIRARWLHFRMRVTLGVVAHLLVIVGLGIYWTLQASAVEILNRAG